MDVAAELLAAQEAYLANVPPWRTVARASAFIGAASKLLVLMPTTSGSREGNVSFNLELIQKQYDDATEWLEANGGGGGAGDNAVGTAANGGQPTRIVRASFVRFRD
ncbi:MAG TPA: hypothetical protein VGN72_19660 [Tepidisphaeraceae bacterium]|jgi:hypothetical protein|nr:hypothetical protein [Tepidisphaeraceae bacterium]